MTASSSLNPPASLGLMNLSVAGLSEATVDKLAETAEEDELAETAEDESVCDELVTCFACAGGGKVLSPFTYHVVLRGGHEFDTVSPMEPAELRSAIGAARKGKDSLLLWGDARITDACDIVHVEMVIDTGGEEADTDDQADDQDQDDDNANTEPVGVAGAPVEEEEGKIGVSNDA